jgi:REP element-mobilizing transposase RayT
MARRLRIEYPGAIYHVMNRGDRREAIFRDDSDRETFLATLGEACAMASWGIHAYCLMGNHFHLVVETPQGNLVAGMKWFLGTYTARFNRRHNLCGHLFSGRYKAQVVDGDSPGYLRTLCEYVHLNPVRANLIPPAKVLKSYRWSSFPTYLEPPRRRVPWVWVERMLGEMGIPKDSAAGRREFERLLEDRRSQDGLGEYQSFRRGWCWGDKAFRREMLTRVSERRGPSHFGAELHESAVEHAEGLLGQGLRDLGWSEIDLATHRKGDKAKVHLAMKLRKETTMTLKWIADRLEMGTAASLSNLLSAKRSLGR